MRQIFTLRFIAALGAVAGLFFVLMTVFATRDAIQGDDGAAEPVIPRRVDLVEHLFSSSNVQFAIGDGLTLNGTRLIIDGSREVTIVPETPGESHCPDIDEVGACAVIADTLGEGVVWFALVPMGTGRTVDLPAIDTLEEGVATLVNGWQFDYAPILDRRCPNDDFESYRQLRDTLGDNFTSVYDIDERRLVAVECRTRVPYAPIVEAPTTTVASTTTTSTTTASTSTVTTSTVITSTVAAPTP